LAEIKVKWGIETGIATDTFRDFAYSLRYKNYRKGPGHSIGIDFIATDTRIKDF